MRELTETEVNSIAERNGWTNQGVRTVGMEAWGKDKTLCLIPYIRPTDPANIHQLILNRRLMYFENRCPCCGAIPLKLNRAQRRALKGQVFPAKVLHESDCPITDEAITEAFKANFN